MDIPSPPGPLSPKRGEGELKFQKPYRIRDLSKNKRKNPAPVLRPERGDDEFDSATSVRGAVMVFRMTGSLPGRICPDAPVACRTQAGVGDRALR